MIYNINYSRVFDQLSLTKHDYKTQNNVTDEDITTGFMIYSAIIYCSESAPLSQYLHNLLTNERPRTIIQSTVNTIQSDDIDERIIRKLLNEF